MSTFSEVKELYTPLTEALEKLSKRREDAEFCKKVDSFFSSYPMPEVMENHPVAVMAPTLVSPNLEMEYFLDVKKHVPIETIFFEYQDDKFVHRNLEKRCLAELIFFKEAPNQRKEIFECRRVVDFQAYQGKRMSDIRTLTGENFVDFHHRIAKEYFKDEELKIQDFSAWFTGGYSFDPELPYLRYLGLFIKDAVLFANFTTSEYESSFTNERVLPAFHKLQEIFGVEPLIIPVEPAETDDAGFWCYYPQKVRELL